jgi:membrane protein required for colicin V production
MNWFDALLLVVVAASAAAGIARGFARIAIGFVAAVLAVVMGAWFYSEVGSILAPYLTSRALANFLGFLLVFLGVVLAGSLLAALLARIFKWAGLDWLDRALGGLVGLLRGGIIAVGIVLAVVTFSPKQPAKWVAGSSLAPYFAGAADMLITITPREMKDGFRETLEELKRVWKSAVQRSPERLPSKEI